MITEQALQEAIAEVQGKRNPNRDDCIMLAAFYTIKDRLYPDREFAVDQKSMSYAMQPQQSENIVTYESGTEFAETIHGMKSDDVWAVMDELMQTLHVINPRLYDGVMRKIVG